METFFKEQFPTKKHVALSRTLKFKRVGNVPRQRHNKENYTLSLLESKERLRFIKEKKKRKKRKLD